MPPPPSPFPSSFTLHARLPVPHFLIPAWPSFSQLQQTLLNPIRATFHTYASPQGGTAEAAAGQDAGHVHCGGCRAGGPLARDVRLAEERADTSAADKAQERQREWEDIQRCGADALWL